MNPNIRDLCRATLFGPTRATNRCVVPLWHGRVLHGVEDATLLWVTDEPIMAKFGLHAVLEQTTGRRHRAKSEEPADWGRCICPRATSTLNWK